MLRRVTRRICIITVLAKYNNVLDTSVIKYREPLVALKVPSFYVRIQADPHVVHVTNERHNHGRGSPGRGEIIPPDPWADGDNPQCQPMTSSRDVCFVGGVRGHDRLRLDVGKCGVIVELCDD